MSLKIRFKTFNLSSLLLLILIHRGLSGTEDEMEKEDSQIFDEFSMLQRLPRADDCNPKDTALTLEFLNLDQTALQNKTDKNLKDLLKVDINCSLRKTNLAKLRRFLKAKGYLANPGSLYFVNAQDHILKMKCNEEAVWKSQGLSHEHKMWGSGKPLTYDEEFHKGPAMVLGVKAPPDAHYFRKYTCTSLNKKKRSEEFKPKVSCMHTFYVITRPKPEIDFPLQFHVDDKAKFSCHIKDCFYTTCANIKSRPQPPYEFQWIVPSEMLVQKGLKRSIHCENGDEDKDALPKGPAYISLKGDSKNPSPDPKLVKGVSITLTTLKKPLSADTGTPFTSVVVKSTISIEKVAEKHRGHYECVIIDGNGVPSMPTPKTIITQNGRYTGKAYLHVRGFIWVIIPLVILGGFVILSFMINFCCPLKMEYDDGTIYTKDELVGIKRGHETEHSEASKTPSQSQSQVSRRKTETKVQATPTDSKTHATPTDSKKS